MQRINLFPIRTDRFPEEGKLGTGLGQVTLGNSGPVAVGWVCPGRAGEFLSTDRNRPQPAWVSLWISRGVLGKWLSHQPKFVLLK